MPPVITRALRSRWCVGSLHAALWFLLYLAVTSLGGKAPEFHEADAAAKSPQSPVPVAAIERLFSQGLRPQSLRDTNALNPFVTRYFVPPAPPAPPPPPTTRKIEVTYQGFYQTGEGLKQTIFRLGDAYVVAPIGARVATNLFIAAATMQAMTLTNLEAQTNIVPLNTKREIVVPLQ
jgi:hypothetical protein